MIFESKQFAQKPGVYLMKDTTGCILYVGKAKNLRKRLGQYFLLKTDHRPQIPFLLAQVESVETIIVSSEKEALLLEHSLIKKHLPKYNLLLKDDKSFICIQITKDEWPALKLTRSKDSKLSSDMFGPYPSAFAARKMLNLLQRLFPLRECSDFVLKNRTRPCILYQIGRCVAPCVQKCSKEEYQGYVSEVRQFLKGHDQNIVKNLQAKMKLASENMEYEKAAHYLETLRHIEDLLEKQNVISASTINCDIIGLYRENGWVSLSLLSFDKGRLLESKNFPLFEDLQDDEELIDSFILQNYIGKKNLPHEIITPALPTSAKAISSLISQNSPHTTKIICPEKGDKVKLLKMAYENAQSAMQKEHHDTLANEELLLSLKEELHLSQYPETIECFDNSHLSGSSPVAVMVTYCQGEYDRSRLRKYHLKTDQVFDDLKGFEEVLLRRYSNQELPLPDLVVVDGGVNQLKVAERVFQKLQIINVDLIALTKEKGRHDFGLTQERVFTLNQKEAIVLPKQSPLLFLLQAIRDKAHKCALQFHQKSRSKKTIKSVLDDIPGIGPKKKQALLKHFKSALQVQKASVEELKEVSGLSQKDIENIRNYFDTLA